MGILNFRNYASLELDLEPGMLLIQGDNGQGKSNLLEAAYMLAIAKSPRASSDRELVRRQAAPEEPFSKVSAVVRRDSESVRVQIDFTTRHLAADSAEAGDVDSGQPSEAENITVQKYFRVNGVPRRASDLVGHVNAVMFSADDLELVYGSPTIRRRYLDILISQSDNAYLKALQRYHRITYQRNHLLKRLRDGSSMTDELRFWDDQIVTEGTHITSQRLRTVRRLSELAGPIHERFTDSDETLELTYRPSVPVGTDASEEELAQAFRQALEARRPREIAQGVTLSGPHRDDLGLLINRLDAGAFASRGQSRTGVLAMKLAEAQYLKDRRHDEPVLLLDDMLSELDGKRRAQVLEMAGRYRQCLITTTDLESVGTRFLSGMARLVVHRGRIETAGLPA